MCATTSLPTPLSPVSRTFASERAASLISDSRYRVTGDFPIRSSPDTTCLTPGAVLSCVVCEHREPVRPSGVTDKRPQQSQPVAQLKIVRCQKRLTAVARCFKLFLRHSR